MKYILILSLTIMGYSCSETGNYPEQIIESNLKAEYDLAQLELYLKYVDCLGKENEDLILQHRFNFFGIDTIDQNVLILFESENLTKISNSEGCKLYNGIGFKNGKVKLLSIGHSVVIDYVGKYKDAEYDKTVTRLFEKESILNSWLKRNLR